MARVVTCVLNSRESAVRAVTEVILGGIPAVRVHMTPAEAIGPVGDPQAHGLGLGAGIVPELIPTLIEEHEHEAFESPIGVPYRIEVEALDELDERVAMDALAEGRPYVA